MSKEFYDYIASNIIGFFQKNEQVLAAGERFCLKLDTEEMVKGVDAALESLADQNGIKGHFTFGSVYSTFTIKISESREIVIASKLDGMTDDFFTTLRNAELTIKKFPILMLTQSTIDSIESGTGDLAASGMPFNSTSIVNRIRKDLDQSQLSIADRTVLETELERKQEDRYSDKSSLFEYADVLTVLSRGQIKKEDYPSFKLFPDPDGAHLQNEKIIRKRIDENNKFFERIDSVFKHGNISEDLEKEFDKQFINHLLDSKRKNLPWYENYTYATVKRSQEIIKKKLDNPLEINEADFIVYSGTPIEYSYRPDDKFFLRYDGDTKSKQRKNNILVFNPDKKDKVTIEINTNIAIHSTDVECKGCTATSLQKKVSIHVNTDGCVFAKAIVKDTNNNVSFDIKVCVVDIAPDYFENINTKYLLEIPANLSKAKIQLIDIDKSLEINPGKASRTEVICEEDGRYDCIFDSTLKVIVGEDSINPDTGKVNFALKIGMITIPIQIKDDVVKPIEMTGSGAFRWKYKNSRSLGYRRSDGRIIAGSTEYFTKEMFRNTLEKEYVIIESAWPALKKTVDGYQKYELNVNETILDEYNKFIAALKEKRTLPSLAYYDDTLLEIANSYVSAVLNVFKNVEPGSVLTKELNDTLLLGCVIQEDDEQIIEMSPVHPLNVIYQIHLLQEINIGEVKDRLVEKLTPLYLIPFIRKNRNLYHAVEQKHSPEWRFYAPVANKRFQGARNYVQKLVYEKIKQYKEHFKFLFDDIGNNTIIINLVNMGDCREVFQGILLYYHHALKTISEIDDLLSFTVNIYSESDMQNEFALLSDQNKIKKYIRDSYPTDEVSELALAMTSKIRCFYRNPKEPQYQYAHLTFYEMATSEDIGQSRMDAITTGIAVNGLVSGTPSVLSADWYKTGFGLKYAKDNQLTRLATYYNAFYRVANSGSSYEPNTGMFTAIEQDQEGKLGKIYTSSNWVVFIDPKVDLSFFQRNNDPDNDLMIIHYSDQYSSASGYDDITVTQKSEQYNDIIYSELKGKGVIADPEHIHNIISLFNAVNGDWLLRLITTKKLTGAADSNFSREKMSILSAIKVCMAYYAHPTIVWVPVSLEEMLRVSGGAGLSQNEGILSAKNLGFPQGATSDDILLVGVEGPKENIKIYIHPVEVKIGQNTSAVISKANAQINNTYHGLMNALWPEEERDSLERKLIRNFFIQMIIVCCEKFKLYNIYPDEKWDDVLDVFREKLLNDEFIISELMNDHIGKGTVVAFSTDAHTMQGKIENDICILEFPEKMGSSYMVKTAREIEKELENNTDALPVNLKKKYHCESGIAENEESNGESSNSVMLDKTISDTAILADDPVIENPDNHDIDDAVSTNKYETIEPEESDRATNIDPGMKVVFGEDFTTGEQVTWEPNDTNKLFHTNTGIIGTMGTGKTQFTKSMVTQLFLEQANNIGEEPLGILIFDYKGDYNESKADFVNATKAKVYIPYNLPFNPLSLSKSKVFKPLLPIHTANAFKDTLTKVYGLGPKQQNTLFQCITRAYMECGIMSKEPSTWDNVPPTFDMVYSIYLNDDEIKKNDSLAAAMDKLATFQVFESDPEKTLSLFDTLKGVVVIDLSGYDADIQSLIVAITLDLFYSQMQASGSSKLDDHYRQLTKFVLVDEADNFMSEGFPALKKILKEGREFGVGTILSTQFLKHFGNGDDDYSKYILTWVVHNVADLKGSDVDFVFKTESKSDESHTLYRDIKALKKHNSIVKIGNAKPKYIKDKAFWQLINELD